VSIDVAIVRKEDSERAGSELEGESLIYAMTSVLSINNLQTRVVLAARIHTLPHSTTDVHPRSTLPASPSSPSPAPSRQRPRLPRCILVCIISITLHLQSLLILLPSFSLVSRVPGNCLALALSLGGEMPQLWNQCPSLPASDLASILPRPHHREHPLTLSQPAHSRTLFLPQSCKVGLASLTQF
jgi:hypothetical protein